jgi:hypothetical protein
MTLFECVAPVVLAAAPPLKTVMHRIPAPTHAPIERRDLDTAGSSLRVFVDDGEPGTALGALRERLRLDHDP